MPELPEVETVCRGMARVLTGRRIARVEVRRPDLRRPIPLDLAERLTGSTVTRITRRAKYALIHTDRGDVVVLHLGMSGRVRVDPEAPEKHDHVLWATDDGHVLVLNDARRFGSLDIEREERLHEHPLFIHLGPEPLGNEFNAESLARALTGKGTPIKLALLDQRVVAGLGNIYVCEALFGAGIDPCCPAGHLSPEQLEKLVAEIRAVLARAIEAGGSSLRDYVQVDGELGYFQHSWQVYGREAEACRVCARPISRIVQSGRSTFYCAHCQR
ncbi:bifunctional DNA-formamidopyrimidine glycosylase/DNA-(apurinic or apyrimidinic site) lyase [Pedomonas mirosovicensis]|uniref:bifunctional DNA-formamidopyrimidine glycosylase/DNA-(apurinic or apyrimidinic site) lyase n=1 Tax=Pedomonas mirosovicensis TaxID=2908641 RepID=UPI002169076C|nr:bifunctional DNA-formamidopyrimidine glycosylase/DNA-(apurinic or apyrimidinic site) lyase [Pedomonas mirosovicensis]MCH8683907.1 bifunctional DNA-formamidopyrimidine glycosylase/DNA-(apurinic or apyrimidinic site) lyase [Pedomonas mirosovicensis]